MKEYNVKLIRWIGKIRSIISFPIHATCATEARKISEQQMPGWFFVTIKRTSEI